MNSDIGLIEHGNCCRILPYPRVRRTFGDFDDARSFHGVGLVGLMTFSRFSDGRWVKSTKATASATLTKKDNALSFLQCEYVN